ncbi:unnamed protein product, partial [marine sediment metagenome]
IMEELSKQARQAKNAYQRNWRKNNPDKLKKYIRDYWERKAKTFLQDEVNRLSEAGHSQREIAESLDISASKVNRILNDDVS